MDAVRVVVVDDHLIVRHGLRTLLRTLPGLSVVGEAEDGRAALEVVERTDPDVVLMDLVMPTMDGVDAIAALKRARPDLPVIALTTFAEADLVVGAVRAGANGYLLKSAERDELGEAIASVRGGQPYLHPEATRHLVAASREIERSVDVLTPREQEVLRLVAAGSTNRQIGDALGMAEKTVSVHVSRVLSKLSLSSRTQAALYAVQVGLVSMG